MQIAQAALSQALQTATAAAFGDEYRTWDPQLRAATKPEFGHLQTNLPLRLAKPLGMSPRDVGQQIIDELSLAVCLPPELAGAGFINLTWKPDFLSAWVNTMIGHPTFGVINTSSAQRVVIDYSSPNVAKQMHVGHLRSTVIGDALSRVLTYAGHDVIAQNHIGDWGTQFGMLIEQLLHEGHDATDFDLTELDALYKRARAHFEASPEFADKSRTRVVALQAGDPSTVEMWERLVAVSLTAFAEMYDRMGALLTEADVAGESSYNAMLPAVVDDLTNAMLLTESDDALCAYPPGFIGRDGNPLPLIVQKSDGGYGYDATDLAAIRHRVDTLKADRIIYVVDARQSLHFDQVLALARQAGWLPDHVTTEHVAFGTVLGQDGKPFKTRSGQTVTLASLLDAAEEKADANEWGSGLPDEVRKDVARAVGIGAVKYADLSNGLGRDYVFDLDRMVAMDGNTGPYLQYAHARLTSLLNKAGEFTPLVGDLTHPAEERLTLLLAGFPEVIAKVVETLEPHHLCGYLYQVASALSSFYEACPVLKAEGATRTTRLTLALATKRVLHTGLDLLGIQAPNQM